MDTWKFRENYIYRELDSQSTDVFILAWELDIDAVSDFVSCKKIFNHITDLSCSEFPCKDCCRFIDSGIEFTGNFVLGNCSIWSSRYNRNGKVSRGNFKVGVEHRKEFIVRYSVFANMCENLGYHFRPSEFFLEAVTVEDILERIDCYAYRICLDISPFYLEITYIDSLVRNSILKSYTNDRSFVYCGSVVNNSVRKGRNKIVSFYLGKFLLIGTGGTYYVWKSRNCESECQTRCSESSLVKFIGLVNNIIVFCSFGRVATGNHCKQIKRLVIYLGI